MNAIGKEEEEEEEDYCIIVIFFSHQTAVLVGDTKGEECCLKMFRVSFYLDRYFPRQPTPLKTKTTRSTLYYFRVQ
jgi:hypothetical protein